jgi:hypothetical protein
MSSVAFWYQIEPHKPWPALPSGPDRLPFSETMLTSGVKAEKQAAHSDNATATQAANNAASDGKFLEFTPPDDKGWLEVPFNAAKEMSIELWCLMIHSANGGKYRVSLDGAELGTVDLFGDSTKPSTHNWGSRKLSAGGHALRFDCVGKAARSQGHNLGFDTLTGRTPVYTQPRLRRVP